MALRPKTSVFQIRIDPVLLQRFQRMCDLKSVVPSEFLRNFIRYQCDGFDQASIKAANKAAQAALSVPQAVIPVVPAIPQVKAALNAPSVSPALQKAREKREKKRSR